MSEQHHHHDDAAHAPQAPADLNRLAWEATIHCLTGCAIGEVLGLVLSSWWGWGVLASVVLATALAFVFGYSLTVIPLLREGLSARRALPLAFASDTLSITIMEMVDNLVVLIIPGAMSAGLNSWLFWASMAVSLALAGLAAFPVNRWLIKRGRGHAVLHAHHRH
jgi:hypothetical protein